MGRLMPEGDGGHDGPQRDDQAQARENSIERSHDVSNGQATTAHRHQAHTCGGTPARPYSLG